MIKQISWSLAATLALSSAAWAAEAASAEPAATIEASADGAAPATFDVFIDGVTGYAFVKTPTGWKFIRSLRDEPLAPNENTKLAQN